jgi:hypothetical protein
VILVSLPLLTLSLAEYFRTYRAWPHLVVVAFASGTFGLGLLGTFMDRFGSGSRPSGSRL